jgi:hypothetical protein
VTYVIKHEPEGMEEPGSTYIQKKDFNNNRLSSTRISTVINRKKYYDCYPGVKQFVGYVDSLGFTA